MIKVVIIDTDSPDKVPAVATGQHAFIMVAEKEDNGDYTINSVGIGNLNVNDFISNLAHAIHVQLSELSNKIGAPYELTVIKLMKALAKARRTTTEAPED